MTRFPKSSASRPQIRRQSVLQFRVTVQAASTVQYPHPLSQWALVEVEQAVGTPVVEALAAELAVAAADRQSARSAGHQSVAALRISWRYDDQPHTLLLRPQRFLRWLFFSFFFYHDLFSPSLLRYSVILTTSCS